MDIFPKLGVKIKKKIFETTSQQIIIISSSITIRITINTS